MNFYTDCDNKRLPTVSDVFLSKKDTRHTTSMSAVCFQKQHIPDPFSLISFEKFIVNGTIMLLLILFLPVLLHAQNDTNAWIVGNVVFVGNKTFTRSKLLGQIELGPSGLFRKVAYSFSQLLSDIQQLETFYRNRGFLGVEISIKEITRDSSSARVYITLGIDEGNRVTIDTVLYEGNTVLSDSRLHAMIPLKQGMPLDSAKYAQTQTLIQDSLAARGYLFAQVQRSFTLDSTQRYATVIYTIQPGPIVVAGGLEIIGHDKVDSAAVQRELVFDRGDTLTSAKIDQSIRRLYRTGLFDLVRIDPIDTIGVFGEKKTIQIPVLIQIEEADMFSLQAGGGYDSYEKFFISAEAAYANLFGLGHRMSVSGKISSDLIGGELSYAYPWFLTLPLDADFMVYVERQDQESFEGLFDGILFALSGKIGINNSYRVWSQIERIEWINQPSPTEEFPEFSAKNTILFGARIGRDTRMTIFDPGDALFAYIEGEIAGPGIAWSNHFYKIKTDFRFYRSLLGSRYRLSSALFFGYAESYDGDEVVPPSELFGIGVDAVRPIRGYDEEAVSPVDSNGTVRGGQLVVVFTPVAFQFPLYKFLNGAVFVDGGYIWARPRDFNIGDIQWSIGPGVVLNLPIGLMRLSYGIRLDGDWDLDGRIYFGIGLPF